MSVVVVGLNHRTVPLDVLEELGLVARPKTVQQENKQLTLELDPTTATPGLRDLSAWERMLADYRLMELSPDSHPMRYSNSPAGGSRPAVWKSSMPCSVI